MLSRRELAAAVAGAVLVRLWDAYVAPVLFARRQRRRALVAGEPCILDTGEATVARFRRGGVTLMHQDLAGAGLAPHVVDFVTKLLVARGADQAFRTKVELVNYKKVMVHMQKACEELEANLSVFAAVTYCGPQEGDKDKRKTAARLAKELDELRGVLHVVRDVRTWTAAICKVPRFPSTARMFIAGDDGITRLPPEMHAQGGLQRRVDDFRKLVDACTPSIMQAIDKAGWPPASTFTTPGKHFCRHCRGRFGKKWIQSSVCWLCRHKLRVAGRCSYADSPSCLVCPHQQRCLQCERVSCAECGLVRATELEQDEGLMVFVQDQNPALIVMDFDQTLCETKSGCVPIPGKHRLNPELHALAQAWGERAVVVSRQPHTNQASVQSFLRECGLPKVGVHCIGGLEVRIAGDVHDEGARTGRGGRCWRKKNKSDVIIPMLRRAREEMHVGGRSVFFFDDDIREVLDDDLSKETSLLRILFVSTSWVHPDPSLL